MGMDSKSNVVKRKNKDENRGVFAQGKLQSGSCTSASTRKSEAKYSNKITCATCLTYGGFLFAVLSLILSVYMYATLGKEDDGVWSANYIMGFFNVKRNKAKILNDKKPSPFDNDSVWILHRRSNLSLGEFIEKYDGKRPVIITDALTGWKANNWSKEFFVKNYGDQQIVMKAVQGTLQQAESLALPIKLFGQHSGKGLPTTWTYLQDELFIQLHPELRDHIGELIYLKEDFFQLFPAEVRPWNAMLLWGTAYSRSYLHIDPYNWTGTNAVFSGKKLWKLYPPGQDEYLYVMPNVKSEFPLNCFKYNSPVDAFNPDLKRYPLFTKAQAILFAQKPGELLIIPPGWFHQAFNEIETIAVSSQVMNSQNYHIILEEVVKVGNIDKNKLPNDFNKLSPVNQVLTVVKLLSPTIIQRGKEVTKDILKQMGYPTK